MSDGLRMGNSGIVAVLTNLLHEPAI